MLGLFQVPLIIAGSSLLTLVLLKVYLDRTIPELLDNVGESIAESFAGIFEKPMTKRAMTILGNESGKVRHDAAAEKALAAGILDNAAPEIKLILDRVAPDFIEQYGPDTVLSLAAKYGPLLERYLPSILGKLENQKSLPENEKFGEF